MIYTILIAVAVGAAIVVLGGLLFVSKYKKKLEHIRDNLDLTNRQNRRILHYINDELDFVNGFKGNKHKID